MVILSEWLQLGDSIDREAAADEFGWSVSLSSDGNIVASSARLNAGSGVNSGHFRIFEFASDAWIQVGDSIVGEAGGDGSGA